MALCDCSVMDLNVDDFGRPRLRLPAILECVLFRGFGCTSGRAELWRGEVVLPWDWQRGKRLGEKVTTTQRESERCNIKDNIGTNGTRI